MLRRAREIGPVVLIPAAWIVVAAVLVGFLSQRALFVAHLVMAALLLTFVVTGWAEMEQGALRAWRVIILAGFGITLAGIGGFLDLGPSALLFAIDLYGWMLLPGIGLIYTGLVLPSPGWLYIGAGSLSILGALVAILPVTLFSMSTAVYGILFTGAGQALGITGAVPPRYLPGVSARGPQDRSR